MTADNERHFWLGYLAATVIASVVILAAAVAHGQEKGGPIIPICGGTGGTGVYTSKGIEAIERQDARLPDEVIGDLAGQTPSQLKQTMLAYWCGQKSRAEAWIKWDQESLDRANEGIKKWSGP